VTTERARFRGWCDSESARVVMAMGMALAMWGAASGAASAQALSRVSVDSGGAQANGLSVNPSVSVDGRYVAFESVASNLVANDTNNSSDIFVKDRQTNAVTRVSVKSDGTEAAGDSNMPRITPDGRFVVFSSKAVLVADDTNTCGPPASPSPSCRDIYVHDMTTGETTRVSVASDGTQANNDSIDPAMSADGRYVVFASQASNLVSGDTNGLQDIFLRDRMLGTTTRLSIGAAAESDGVSFAPSISSDGTIVLFTSFATTLVATPDPFSCSFGTGACSRVYLLDRTSGGGVSRVPLENLPGQIPNLPVTRVDFPAATLSADGRTVVFERVSTSVPAGASDPLSVRTDAAYHRTNGHFTQLRPLSNELAPSAPAVDAAGRVTAFCQPPSGLGLPLNVQVFDLVTQTSSAVLVTPPSTKLELADCRNLTLSGDGNVVAFVSADSTVVPGDTNLTTDVFAFNRDTDHDGIPDEWETKYGLNPNDAADASLDPDGDGKTNLQEYLARTHPNGAFTRYLAEGVANQFFGTQIVGYNPNETAAVVLLRYLGDNGEVIAETLQVPARTQFKGLATFQAPAASFSTTIESDKFVAVERTVVWGAGVTDPDDFTPYGSHAETAIARPSTTWYFAEGATHGRFDLFYLLQNANDTAATATITYLLPGSQAPIVRQYAIAPQSRLTIKVDDEPGLGATDVSAKIVSDLPILAERAMYLSTPTQPYAAGTDGAGIPEPGTQWFVAEGATGGFFDLFILIGNPSAQDADVTITYLLPDGTSIDKHYAVARESRLTINVDGEDPGLAGTSVSAIVKSTNSVPIVVERAMWWPSPDWYEGHVTAATNETGATWALADGRSGGPPDTSTFLLVANPGDTVAHVTFDLSGSAPVTGGSKALACTKTVDIAAHSRFTGELRTLCDELRAESFVNMGGTIHSEGSEIVVERSTYWSTNTQFWAAGASTLLTKIP
jgi:Tol biopolymer transport system component